MYNLQEQEQIDAVKAWWTDHGRWVIVAGLLGLLGLAGQRGWHYTQAHQDAAAGALFFKVEAPARSADAEQTLKAAQAIENAYPEHALAVRAALMAAATSHAKGDQAGARSQLEWVVQHGKEPPLVDLARLREARLVADQKKYDEALGLLNQNQNPDFAALTLDLRGDLLLALGRRNEALAAYQGAVQKSSPADGLHQIAQTKLDALGGGR